METVRGFLYQIKTEDKSNTIGLNYFLYIKQGVK